MTIASITVHAQEPGATINPLLYGHFVEHLGRCVDEGIWVGPDSPIPNDGGIRLDVVEALRRLRPPVVRWPGGCFADDYHWEDGVGPTHERPRRVNIWWGEDIETNAFGTHEFIRFCRLVGAAPYFAGNVGSGSPRELRDWVEYCNFAGDSTLARRRGANGSPAPFGVRFWGVGNENWGCGGNYSPGEYAAEYRRFATYLRDFGDAPLFLIACGPNGDNREWTREFFTTLTDRGRYYRHGFERLHGYAAHYYTGNRDASAGTATDYDHDGWYRLLAKGVGMEGLIEGQRALMDEFDPERRVGLIIDEWGTWHPPAPGHHPRHLWQQNTLRDALVAALTLDIFNRHADKVVMANIAQLANVLQSLVLTEGDRLVLTPTYHVFSLYAAHQDGTSLRTSFEADAITFGAAGEGGQLPGLGGSASIKNGVLTLSVVNPHAGEPCEATITLRGGRRRETAVAVLTADDLRAHNTVEAPDRLRPRADSVSAGEGWRYTFPPASVTVFTAPLAT